MKTALALAMFVLVALAALVVPPCRAPAFAQAQGCCKERDSLSSRAWRQNGLSFENCRRLNDKRDGDNVGQPSGFIWWDGRCG
jgi:hypothetical protein